MAKPYYQDDYVTIYHGDSLDILESLAFDVVISDPPYGVSATTGHGGVYDKFSIVGDGCLSARDGLLSKISVPYALFGSPKMPKPECKATLIWNKGEHTGMGDLNFPWKPDFEEIYVNGDGWSGSRTSSVIRVHMDISSFRHHPTEKPLGIMYELIKKAPQGTILDPFMGSGTTLRAAKDLGRKAIGIEIEEKYCEIAAKRMAQEVLNFGT